MALQIALLRERDVVLAGAAAGDPDGRLPAAHLHRLPRLHARLVPADQARQPHPRRGRRRDRLHPLPDLAPQPRDAPRDGRRPRPPRAGRRPDHDRGRVPRPRLADARRLPRLPQPAGHVRPRLAVGPRHPAAHGLQERAHAPQALDLGDQPRARRARHRHLPARRPGQLLARPGPGRRARRLGGRLPLLRPAPVRGHLLGEHGRVVLRRTPRCAARPTSSCRSRSSSSRATSACTTCTTCRPASRTTGCRTRSTTSRLFDDVPGADVLGRREGVAAEGVVARARAPAHLGRGAPAAARRSPQRLSNARALAARHNPADGPRAARGRGAGRGPAPARVPPAHRARRRRQRAPPARHPRRRGGAHASAAATCRRRATCPSTPSSC